jgi:putative phosphoribosyl transferase
MCRKIILIQLKEIGRRLISFRGSKEYDRELKGKTVVLVDDGIATGAKMLSAAQWLKTKQNCQELIIAVPVAP